MARLWGCRCPAALAALAAPQMERWVLIGTRTFRGDSAPGLEARRPGLTPLELGGRGSSREPSSNWRIEGTEARWRGLF